MVRTWLQLRRTKKKWSVIKRHQQWKGKNEKCPFYHSETLFFSNSMILIDVLSGNLLPLPYIIYVPYIVTIGLLIYMVYMVCIGLYCYYWVINIPSYGYVSINYIYQIVFNIYIYIYIWISDRPSIFVSPLREQGGQLPRQSSTLGQVFSWNVMELPPERQVYFMENQHRKTCGNEIH